MDKKIFNEQINDINITSEFKPKQEFIEEEITLEADIVVDKILEERLLTEKFERVLQPQPRVWKKILGLLIVLFLIAVVAQSVQWLVDSWANNQWIDVGFSLLSFIVVLIGLLTFIKEWYRLIKLKKRMVLQQRSEQILLENTVNLMQDLSVQGSEEGKNLCLQIAQTMQIEAQSPALNLWLKEINDSHSAREIVYLFVQNVLKPIDRKAQQLISKNAAEAAIIVAISPLALIDMFFITWRNIHLINNIANIYGIELGYVGRLHLLRMVLLNVAFAGAAELVQEVGMEWLSQDLTAKFSARVAQGIGIGLLTARLGIKAMEFCRPLVFSDDKPRLANIHKELLTALKSSLLNTTNTK